MEAFETAQVASQHCWSKNPSQKTPQARKYLCLFQECKESLQGKSFVFGATSATPRRVSFFPLSYRGRFSKRLGSSHCCRRNLGWFCLVGCRCYFVLVGWLGFVGLFGFSWVFFCLVWFSPTIWVFFSQFRVLGFFCSLGQFSYILLVLGRPPLHTRLPRVCGDRSWPGPAPQGTAGEKVRNPRGAVWTE